MRRALLLLLVWFPAACVVQTESVEGEQGLEGETGPEGPKGDTGPQGPEGPPGASPLSLLDGNAVFMGGDLLIGTQSLPAQPGSRHIALSAGTSGDAQSWLLLQGARTLNSTFAGVLAVHKSQPIASIEFAREGADDAASIFFVTHAAGAPDSAIRMWVSSNGNVGIGTTAPTARLHVDGNIKASGTITGDLVDNCSWSLKQDVHELGTDEAAVALAALRPVRFRYKDSPDDEQIGFIAEDVPELVATRDRRGVSPMDIAAVLTRVAQAQDATIKKQQQLIDEQKRALASLTSRLERLERAHYGAHARP